MELNSKWVLWYHAIDSKDWLFETGYEKICTIETMDDFWILHNKFMKDNVITNGMYYLMREDYVPLWEKNPDGCTWSFRVDKEMIADFWIIMAMLIVGENIEVDEEIIGLSSSPKYKTSTFSVWLKNNVNDAIYFEKSIELSKEMKIQVDFSNAVHVSNKSRHE